ncbi:MAG: DUF4912 domain-containing protein, partial [Nitrospirota bacterium]
ITLMVVDPYRLFVFWDADRKDVDNVVHNGEGYRTVIRVYIFEGDNEAGYFDIRADHLSDEIYLDVIPDRGYMVEFGVIKGEQFTSLASSRRKFTPVFGIDNEDLSYEAFEMMIKHLPNGENRLSS